MKICDAGIYEIHLPTSGGKGGKGKNKTTSVQVCLSGNGTREIVKQFRVEANSKSIAGCISRVKAWVSENPIGPIK